MTGRSIVFTGRNCTEVREFVGWMNTMGTCQPIVLDEEGDMVVLDGQQSVTEITPGVWRVDGKHERQHIHWRRPRND
jgi:hypothetical protein